jgi:hypothetical protein
VQTLCKFPEIARLSEEKMVRAAGFEPATPTV